MAKRVSGSSVTTLIVGIALGACATAASTSQAEAPAVDANTPASPSDPASTVVPLAEAPRHVAPPGTATITHLARGLNAYVGKLEMDGGGAVPEHRDATEEFIHVLSGGGTITIDGTSHLIEAGTTIYMPAEALVSYENGPEPMTAIQVFAGPAPAAKYDGWAPAE
jgi:quercetin dioxygenase-like cupin family protein